MIQILKNVSLFLISAPLFFLLAGEYLDESFRNNGFVILILAVLVCLLCCSLVYLWQKKFSSHLLFGIGRAMFEGTKRTSLILGVTIGVPLSFLYWREYDPTSYVSSVPYFLMAPGVAVLGFITVSTIVCGAFWCIEGFRPDGKENE